MNNEPTRLVYNTSSVTERW